MIKRNLIIDIPVIHSGYLNVFITNVDKISTAYILDEQLRDELTMIKPNIASLDTVTTKQLLNSFGFRNILILSHYNIKELKDQKLLLVQDEVSRNLHEKYLQKNDVEWISVFLKWDRESVSTQTPVDDNILSSSNAFDHEKMQEAYAESKKSSDSWRQVGGVLVKEGAVIFRAYNQGVPSDHTPYQVGAVRDFLKAGEKPELVNYIHVEQKIIAQAAKTGTSLARSSLYITHFPCPVCAKLIAYSGIRDLYFSEGWSTLDGKQILEASRINLFRIPRDGIIKREK